MDYAHRNLIVHRDLKPGNILVTADGALTLLDFGTASLKAENLNGTLTGPRALTPRYASPEQFRCERASLSNDIFSLGILYESLAMSCRRLNTTNSPARTTGTACLAWIN